MPTGGAPVQVLLGVASDVGELLVKAGQVLRGLHVQGQQLIPLLADCRLQKEGVHVARDSCRELGVRAWLVLLHDLYAEY